MLVFYSHSTAPLFKFKMIILIFEGEIMEKNMPKQGEFCWNELMTPDAHKAKEFYRSLFGWEFQSKKVDNTTYERIQASGKPGGGLMQMTPDEVSKIPPHWMTYVYVDNVDDSVAKARKLGAKIVVPTTAVEDCGCFASLQDPTGAHIGIWQSPAVSLE